MSSPIEKIVAPLGRSFMKGSWLSGRSVLVTGGAGFIGTNLLTRLVEYDVEITATYRHMSPSFQHRKVAYTKADLTRMEDCTRVVKNVDVVFMCAAVSSGAAAIASNPLQHVTPNIVANSQMLEASYRGAVKKFLYLGSTVMYPPTGWKPTKESEGFKRDPYPAYFAAGWTCRYTEVLCQLYSKRLSKPLPTVVLRPTNAYGPHDKFDPETSHVTAALIKKVVERQNPLVVWGTGNDVRDLVYIEDLVDGIILAIEKVDKYNPINIGLGKGHTVKQVLRMLLELDRYEDAKVTYDRSWPSMLPVRLVDISKARKLLGYSPKVSLKDGLKRTLEWYRKSGPGSGRCN
jgi:GDP-L-fucose synthase